VPAGEVVGDGNPDGTVFGQASEKIGFYGLATPVVKQATAAAGTDATTTQALANALRTAMLNYNLIG
jgi:hypothetical protein